MNDKFQVIKATVLEVINDFTRLRLAQKSKALAFSLIIMFLPIIVMVIVLSTMLSPMYYQAIAKVAESFPTDIQNVILNFVESNQGREPSTMLLVFTVGYTLFSVVTNLNTLVEVINEINEVEEERSPIHTLFISFSVLVLTFASFILVALFVAFGQIARLVLQSYIGVDNALYATISTILELKFWTTFFVLFITFLIVYKVTPNIKQRIRDVVPGALVATLAIGIFTNVFEVRMSNGGSIAFLYGSYASLLLGLLWFYFLSQIIVYSAYVNAFLQRRRNQAQPVETTTNQKIEANPNLKFDIQPTNKPVSKIDAKNEEHASVETQTTSHIMSEVPPIIKIAEKIETQSADKVDLNTEVINEEQSPIKTEEKVETIIEEKVETKTNEKSEIKIKEK